MNSHNEVNVEQSVTLIKLLEKERCMQDRFGFTALMIIANRSNKFTYEQLVTLIKLLEKEIGMQNEYGETALMIFLCLKQKTGYEMTECDWSSEVCSSDRE